jgi:hypothetical protein
MGIPNDVCSYHDDGCADHSDEGFDVEEVMRNVAPDVLL